jgi:tRNA U34 2-thiouridine synthase MnmA/TrmU
VATGQAAVLYSGDTVLGSGTIASTAALAGTAV